MTLLQEFVLKHGFDSWCNADDLRESYAPTPMWVRRLFVGDSPKIATDEWLVAALEAGSTPLFAIDPWVDKLVRVSIPTIHCYPSKALGKWRIYNDHAEWYVNSADLVP